MTTATRSETPEMPVEDDELTVEPDDSNAPRLSRRRLLAGGLASIIALVAGVVYVSRRRLESARAQLVDDLLAGASTREAQTVDHEALADLPTPARQYFETVLPEGEPLVRTARMEQDGEFRLGDADSAWQPMTATQHVRTDPPGFVWDATIELAPFVPVDVVDAYVDGEGWLTAKLLSTVTVADDGPNPRMNEGELLRYLVEAVWYPTALLPAAGVEWEPVDDRSARATLTDAGDTVSAVFHFDDEHLIERMVVEERARAVDGGYEDARWVGTVDDYERHGGLLVPTTGQVAWDLPGGELPYWRAEITEFDFQPTGDRPDQGENHQNSA